jgi:hypothetical protein
MIRARRNRMVQPQFDQKGRPKPCCGIVSGRRAVVSGEWRIMRRRGARDSMDDFDFGRPGGGRRAPAAAELTDGTR